jgi:hypothetical protein
MGVIGPRSRPAGWTAIAGVTVALLLASCTSPIDVRPSASVDPGLVTPSSSPGSPVASPSAEASAAVASPIPWDDALIGILPHDVDGLVVSPDRETAASLAGDPELTEVARGLVYALAVDPTTDAFALASVVRFAPGILDDEFYRDWRDSFDEGACSQAGGVAGHAQAEIAGRPTFIGTCAGGLHTYHVSMPADGIVVSVSSFGEGRLGELLVAGLQDPA